MYMYIRMPGKLLVDYVVCCCLFVVISFYYFNNNYYSRSTKQAMVPSHKETTLKRRAEREWGGEKKQARKGDRMETIMYSIDSEAGVRSRSLAQYKKRLGQLGE